jgi:hypothetical protein
MLKDPKFEVVVIPDDGCSVWAYFPVNRRRWIVTHHKLALNPKTRVLLVFSAPAAGKEPVKNFEGHLRDHLGHVMLYLRSPKANNDCDAAWKEWRGYVAKPATKKAAKKRSEP